MPARLLALGALRARRRRHVAAAATLAAAFLAFLVAGMLLAGARAAVQEPLVILSGDVRVTQGSSDLAAGATWDDHRAAAQRIREIPGAVAAPRMEASQVLARATDVETWSAGLLVGIDPAIPEEQAFLAGRLEWGTTLPATSLVDPASGKAYVPLLVGAATARRLELHPGPGGGPDFAHVLRLTSGRFAQGTSAPPVDAEAVVVGVFASGLDPLDRFTVLAPIQDVRLLVGRGAGDPAANAIVVHGATAAQVEALGLGATVQGRDAFARYYLGLVLLVVEAAAAAGTLVFLAAVVLTVTREAGLQMARDAQLVAALRAIGIPERAVLASYGGLALAAVGAAAVVAAGVAALWAAVAPPVALRAGGVWTDVPWRMSWPLVGLVAAVAVAVSGLATLAVARRLRRANLADALRAA